MMQKTAPCLEDDRSLLVGYKTGGAAALTRVFELYIDDVLATIRAGVQITQDGKKVRVGTDLDEADIENIAQEAFAKAFAPRNRVRYDGLRPFGAWLATIVRNLMIDRARRLKRQPRLWSDDAPDRLVSGEGDPVEIAEERELGQLLNEFILQLDANEREIFSLRYEHGLSLRDVAKEKGIGTFVVRRHDAHIRNALLSFLRANGFLQSYTVRIGQTAICAKQPKVT